MKGFEVSQALRAFPGRHATDLTRGGIGCQWAFCDEHRETHTHTHNATTPMVACSGRGRMSFGHMSVELCVGTRCIRLERLSLVSFQTAELCGGIA